jgi:cell division protein FtsB
MEPTGNDLLAALSNQRNNALNECAQLAAQLAASQRRVAELEAKVKDLEAPRPNGEAHP